MIHIFRLTFSFLLMFNFSVVWCIHWLGIYFPFCFCFFVFLSSATCLTHFLLILFTCLKNGRELWIIQWKYIMNKNKERFVLWLINIDKNICSKKHMNMLTYILNLFLMVTDKKQKKTSLLWSTSKVRNLYTENLFIA